MSTPKPKKRKNSPPAPPTLRERFLAFDDELADLGVKPLTEWWRTGLGEWLDRYERDHVLELWACAGRGSAKSTVLYKLACFFALFGDFAVPLAEMHYAVVLSRLKEEAAKGITIIDGWLTLLGVEHRLAGDVVELPHLRRGIRVVAASVAATSGWRAFFVGSDERSKWGYDGAENVDGDEVDTSSAAMTATHPFAPIPKTGSAWGTFGSFWEAVTGGSDASRHVLGPAPTWVAAPHITEADTRRKERNLRRWAREYQCVFTARDLACFDPEEIDRAEALEIDTSAPEGQPVVIIDASSGGKDAFAWGVARRVRLIRSTVERRAKALVAEDAALEIADAREQAAKEMGVTSGIEGVRVDRIDSADTRQSPTDAIVRRIARLAGEVGARSVHGDQRDAHALESMFRQLGIRFVQHTWTESSKPRAVEIVRRWFRDETLSLQKHEQLHKELLMFEERITSLGEYTFRGRRDDHVSLLLTLALTAESSAALPRPPRIAGHVSRHRRGGGEPSAFRGCAPDGDFFGSDR